jgi:hypothetical protein
MVSFEKRYSVEFDYHIRRACSTLAQVGIVSRQAPKRHGTRTRYNCQISSATAALRTALFATVSVSRSTIKPVVCLSRSTVKIRFNCDLRSVVACTAPSVECLAVTSHSGCETTALFITGHSDRMQQTTHEIGRPFNSVDTRGADRS